MAIEENTDLKIFKDHFKLCIDCYDVMGRDDLQTLHREEKGHIINSGECGQFAKYVIDTLPQELNKKDIKIWEWETIHTFIVAYDKIWDAHHCYNGKEYTRDNVNLLFLCYASSLAFGLHEHYYIQHNNGQCILYDPWEFVDNQCYDHDRFPVYPSRETVYTVDEFLSYWKARENVKRKTLSMKDFFSRVERETKSK